jgi:hypothetical protein
MLSARGYRKREPGELPQERPSVVQQMLNTHLKANHHTVDELSRVALVTEPEFRTVYGLEAGVARRGLHVVS